MGITVGYSDLEFKGHRPVSRQEMASFITRTLAHTNVRPRGLTAQSSGTGVLSIQVSMRTETFEPIDNEAIDVFGTASPEGAFTEDGECVGRYVGGVVESTSTCEIDAGDFVTGSEGNVEFTASASSISAEDTVLHCGTLGYYEAGEPAGTEADVQFWAWNGEFGEEVNEETKLVEVVHVSPFSRTASAPAHHISVTGGLDEEANQLEARFGQEVEYTVQIHADPDLATGPMGEHLNVGPNKTGNKLNMIVSKYAVVYVDDGDPAIPDLRMDRDGAVPGLQASRGTAEPFSRTPGVVTPDATDGSYTISITHPDPDAKANNDDVIVVIQLVPDDDNDIPIDEGGTDTDNDGVNDLFTAEIVFSDDGVDQERIAVSAETVPAYREAPSTGRSAQGSVTVTVIDQYGRPVKGQGVHAVSDAGEDSNASPDNTVRFQNWYVTRSSGSYPISYSYRGGIGIETLNVIETGAPKTDDPSLLAADAENTNSATTSLYWVVDGDVENAPTDGYGPVGDDDPAAGDYLVIDTDNNTFVVFQAEIIDDGQTDADESRDAGPRAYDWDDRDTFTVGSDRVSMALFEEILDGGTKENEVTSIDEISWEDYDYYVFGDRAHWTIEATCTRTTQ